MDSIGRFKKEHTIYVEVKKVQDLHIVWQQVINTTICVIKKKVLSIALIENDQRSHHNYETLNLSNGYILITIMIVCLSIYILRMSQ